MRNGIHSNGDFGADMFAVSANPIVVGPIQPAPVAPNLLPIAAALFTDGASLSASQIAASMQSVQTANPAQNNLQLMVNSAMGLMTLYFVYTFWTKKLARMQ